MTPKKRKTIEDGSDRHRGDFEKSPDMALLDALTREIVNLPKSEVDRVNAAYRAKLGKPPQRA